MIISCFFKALSQIGDPRFWGVLVAGLGLTLALFVGLGSAMITAIGWVVPDTITLPWVGDITWVDTALSWAAVPVFIILSVVLMVPVAAIFTGVFLDRIAAAVEARHYPDLPAARSPGLAEAIVDALKFLGVMTVANLIALIFYLIFLPIGPVIFCVVNGILLGREYGQMVALRRQTPQGAAAFRRRHWFTLSAAGILMAVPLTIPVVNLFVPILGVASFTHIYHRLMARHVHLAG
jgi:uncharacterized protein involved in cysteine biosynthesis